MREVNEKQMRIQFSSMSNEKLTGWVCSLQPSDHSMTEMSACPGGLQNSALPHWEPYHAVCVTQIHTVLFFFLEKKTLI